jgi:multidrug/hemolysin transport system ATP-binding protein
MIEEIQEKSGMTIFLTTHYMEEADDADQVCIIDRGEIVASGTPTELKNEYSNDKLRIKPKDMDELSTVLTNDNVEYKVQNDLIVIALDDVFAGNAIVHKYRNYIKTFEILNGTLDDAFVNITGRELRE